MGLYAHLRQLWKQPNTGFGAERKRNLLVTLRREPSTIRLEYPSRLDRAHALGYKAKKGIFVVRQRVIRGGHTRPSFAGGRRSKNFGKRLNLRLNYQVIAEQRAQKSHKNCEVLNSYYFAQDGKHYWYEVIMADRASPDAISAKPWLSLPANRGRVFRGLTSAGRKVRGLRHRGTGAEKARPSRRANSRLQ